MEFVERIGAYAGIAAAVGLVVLAALVISQARDLRRLRESTGGALGGAPGGRGTGAQPATSRPTAPPYAGAPARGPGASHQAPATVAQRAPATTGGNGDGAAATSAPTQAGTGPGPATAAGAGAAGAAAATGARPQTGGPFPAGGPATTPNGAVSGAPGRPPAASPRPARPSPADEPWYRRTGAVVLALLALLAVVLVIVAVIGITRLVGGGSPEAAQAPGRSALAPVRPADVTYSVLNATAVDGLASRVADRLEAKGFRRGNVTNAADPQVAAESIVLFGPGKRREATAVARQLGITQTRGIDRDSKSLAGDADVVVRAGDDLTR